MKENEGKRDLIILNVHLIQAEVLYSNSGMILQLWVKKNLFLLLWNFCHVFDYQIIVSIYVSIYEWTESTGATVVNSLSHVHQEIKEKSLFFFISSFFFHFHIVSCVNCIFFYRYQKRITLSVQTGQTCQMRPLQLSWNQDTK